MKYLLLFLLETWALASCVSVIPGVAVDDRNGERVRMKREVSKTSLTQEERSMFLEAHNIFRANVTPTAANMQRMYYSSEIEKAAQTWANRCVWGHGQPDISKNKYNNLGQNIYAGGKDPMAIVGAWEKEKKDYNFANVSCNATCGHYTQVVWSNSYVLGCGMAYCSGMGAYYVVCNYYYRGNYKGARPYESGPSCTKCPKEAGTCAGKLCGGMKCSEIEPNCTVVDNEHCFCAESDYLKSGVNKSLLNPLLVALVLCFAFLCSYL